jgi:O-antigen/teichoic acid export membrane protein
VRLAGVVGALRASRLAKNTLWMTLGQGLRVVVQGVYFILIARALGVEGYGAFVGALAIVSTMAPFSGLGCGNLLVRSTSRDRTLFRGWWGYALFATSTTGTLLFLALAFLLRGVLVPAIPLELLVAVAAADLVFTRLVDVSAQAFQAFEQIGRTAQLHVLPTAVRLAGVVALLIAVPRPSATDWAYVYLAASVVSAGAAVWMVCSRLGTPAWQVRVPRHELRDGFYFSLGLGAQGVYNDVDKVILSSVGTLGATGVYGAAYRIIDVAFTPVRAVLYAAYPGFFQHGQNGVRATVRYARELLPAALGWGAGAGLLLFACAPLAPLVLGSGFRESAEALRWLALLPLLKSLHYFAADSLTGAGHHGLRTGVQVLMAFMNAGLNLLLIPLYSWKGAAVASLVCDGVLAAVLWGSVGILFLREHRTLRHTEPAVLSLPGRGT